MDQPIPADTKPAVLELEPGTYWWCRCGRSAKQPWCDGSHKVTGLEPVEVVIEERKSYALCMCKQSGNGAFCDGTHKKL